MLAAYTKVQWNFTKDSRLTLPVVVIILTLIMTFA